MTTSTTTSRSDSTSQRPSRHNPCADRPSRYAKNRPPISMEPLTLAQLLRFAADILSEVCELLIGQFLKGGHATRHEPAIVHDGFERLRERGNSRTCQVRCLNDCRTGDPMTLGAQSAEGHCACLRA